MTYFLIRGVVAILNERTKGTQVEYSVEKSLPNGPVGSFVKTSGDCILKERKKSKRNMVN